MKKKQPLKKKPKPTEKTGNPKIDGENRPAT